MRGLTIVALSFVSLFLSAGVASPVREATVKGPACRWNVVPVKHPLWGLAASGRGQVWAVGSGPTIQRFDGRRSQVVPSPRVPRGYLEGVFALSDTYAWSVGATSTARSSQPLIEHWDGRRWTVVPSPRVAGGYLEAVTASSVSDAWAVGGVDELRPLIAHWDGKRWSRVPTTKLPKGTLSSVTAMGEKALAVGSFAAAWDGTRWRRVPVPFKKDPESWLWGLTAVAAYSRSEAWAVGFEQIGNTIVSPIIERWSGGRFRQVPAAGDALIAVAARASDDAWAVGLADTGIGGASIAHWNGARWQTVAPPRGSDEWFLEAVAVPRRGDVWVVGYRDPDPDVGGNETSFAAHGSCR